MKVIGIDQANRINLSIKQVAPPPQRGPVPTEAAAPVRAADGHELCPARPQGTQRF